MKVKPIILSGEFVSLEPLGTHHLVDLENICFDQNIWRWFPFSVKNVDDIKLYVDSALINQKAGIDLPFVTIDKATDKIVGSTRFMNIDIPNLRVEIGSTWINPSWQRTYVNTEAKVLMLTHAFEIWKCIRVEFKTDALNERSRQAILRLGAKEEGTFRQHLITQSGRLRDSVYFSILDKEWGQIKEKLKQKLES